MFVAGACLLLAAVWMAGCGGSDEPSAAEQADTMQSAHEGDRPEATAAAREPEVSVEGDTVPYGTTEGGEAITGYIAAPTRPDSVLEARGMNPDTATLPGLIVIHEWWGLNDNIRTATRRLAGEGYRALAVDLYGGASAETPDAARDLMQSAMSNQDQLLVNLEQAHTYLRDETGAPSVAVMGWCFGGGMTLKAAVNEPTRLDGAIVYYGSPSGISREDLEPVDFPMIGFFGENDQAIAVDAVRDLEQTLADLEKDAEFHYYDAGHAFANPSGRNYDAEAAEDAWEKTTAFLQETLYDASSE